MICKRSKLIEINEFLHKNMCECEENGLICEEIFPISFKNEEIGMYFGPEFFDNDEDEIESVISPKISKGMKIRSNLAKKRYESISGVSDELMGTSDENK